MSDAAKKRLHDLVDVLPESETAAAQRYLEYLRDQGEAYVCSDDYDPIENMSDEARERLHAAVRQSEREFAEGKGIPAEEVLAELRATR